MLLHHIVWCTDKEDLTGGSGGGIPPGRHGVPDWALIDNLAVPVPPTSALHDRNKAGFMAIETSLLC